MGLNIETHYKEKITRPFKNYGTPENIDKSKRCDNPKSASIRMSTCMKTEGNFDFKFYQDKMHWIRYVFGGL